MKNMTPPHGRTLQSGIMLLLGGVLLGVAAVLNTRTLAIVFSGLAAVLCLGGGISKLIATESSEEQNPSFKFISGALTGDFGIFPLSGNGNSPMLSPHKAQREDCL